MLRQLFQALRGEPGAPAPGRRDPLRELLEFPEPALRALFTANYQRHTDYPGRSEERQAAHAAAFAGDPLPLALDLLDLAPRWDAWYRQQPRRPDIGWLDGAFTGTQDVGRTMSVAHHGSRLPMSAGRLAQALDAAAQLVAMGNHGRYGGVGWLDLLVEEAAARSDPASRAALLAAFERLLAAKRNEQDDMLRRVESLLPRTGMSREDVPGLIAHDRRVAELDQVRTRVFAALGEPIGAALEAVLDQDRTATAMSLSEAAKHPAMRALADLSPAERGAAFHRLLAWLSVNRTRFDTVGWNEIQKRGGRYRLDIVPPEMPTQVGNLLGVLAVRKISLVDPDGDIATFLTLLRLFPLLGYRKIIDLVLATVATHPHGRAAKALQAALDDKLVIALNDYRVQAEDVLRGMASSASAQPGSFGHKGMDEAASPGIPPLPAPTLAFDDWNACDVISQHFDNLLDVRLFDAPHQAVLSRLTALAADLIDANDATPEEVRAIQERWRDLSPGSDQDRARVAHSVANAAALGADLRRRFDAVAPFVTKHPEVSRQLGRLATEMSSKSTPTAKWLAEGRRLLSPIPADERIDLLRAVAAAPSPSGFPVANGDQLRTLLFLSADLDAAVLGPLLTDYALKRCYVSEPFIGTRNEKLGNACLWTLAALPDGAGVPFLARVLARTKYPKIRARVDAKLNEAAAAAGIDRATLDELTVPMHDLDRDGRRPMALAGGTATLRMVDGRSVAIDWTSVDGKLLKAPSTAMKADGDALKAVRAAAKELEADLVVQPIRLQRLYLEDRHWPAALWRERYLDHPLLRALASRLIWAFDRDGTTISALPDAQGIADVAGRPVPLDGATVRLWHPIEATAAEIEAWRDRLEALQLTQPFAQAWREVYALTEAERMTGTYSNRWAAHLLKQHQAMTLARLNGWRVTHRVAFDTPNDQPWHVAIPAHGLVADYWVEGTGGDDPVTTESGAYAYVTTDRVQFHAADGADSARGPIRGRAVPLVELPSIVFSEVMRHADLFTAVASIAADPNWLDRGGDVEHPSQWDRTAATYWQRINGAELEESGKRRRAMLARIVPRLKIAAKLELDDRYLAVQGRRHRYRIHLGSGACFRSERHICIVPAQERASGKLWLPFEGDRTLSIILSKAALLAGDDKITDPVILAQL